MSEGLRNTIQFYCFKDKDSACYLYLSTRQGA
nr:MAG TPA: hypothetical protein [Crassvirales sp.]